MHCMRSRICASVVMRSRMTLTIQGCHLPRYQGDRRDRALQLLSPSSTDAEIKRSALTVIWHVLSWIFSFWDSCICPFMQAYVSVWIRLCYDFFESLVLHTHRRSRSCVSVIRRLMIRSYFITLNDLVIFPWNDRRSSWSVGTLVSFFASLLVGLDSNNPNQVFHNAASCLHDSKSTLECTGVIANRDSACMSRSAILSTLTEHEI